MFIIIISGSILCNDCSSTRVILRHVNAKSPVRVCGGCHDTLRADPNFGAINASAKSGSSRSVYTPRSDDSLDTPALLKMRSQMLDEIDGSRKSAVAREEDDDMSPGENCCYVCVSEFSLFKKKQTCMNWYVYFTFYLAVLNFEFNLIFI